MGILGSKMADSFSEVTIHVKTITSIELSKELLTRCGDEDQQENLNERGKATLKFIKAAIAFIPHAKSDGADLANTAFILTQPGREFVLKAGNGDWEYQFSENEDGKVCGERVRTGSYWCWIWDSPVGKFVRTAVSTICYDVILPVLTERIRSIMPNNET